MKIYLAGKIGHTDWRHTIVTDLRCLPAYGDWAVESPWPITERVIFNTHDYVGPYFVSDDHGCAHGPSSHGVGLDQHVCSGWGQATHRNKIAERCIESLRHADLVFAWIDREDAYGTLVELGMAHAMGKDICIAGPGPYADLWFVYELANTLLLNHPTALAALQAYLAPAPIAPRNLQAIETEYNGYKFRSRLEARWAVFFDTAGIRYEYEAEGFQAGGSKYLPDFWLPDHQAWVEIKPESPATAGVTKLERFAIALFRDGMDRTHTARVQGLADSTANTRVYLLTGQPWYGPTGYAYAAHDYTSGGVDTLLSYWLPCRACQGLGLRRAGGQSRCVRCNTFSTYAAQQEPPPALMTAYTAARQARFEFGQTPGSRR